jgi:hypothetical protein
LKLGAKFMIKIANTTVALCIFLESFKYRGLIKALWYGTIISVISNTFQILFHVVQVGSVDEESTKSDEEYDDLAMQDVPENGYWSDDDEEFKNEVAIDDGNKYRQNLDLFLRTRSEPVPESFCSYSSLLKEKVERRLPPSGKARLRKRSLSISALGKGSSAVQDPIPSGTPQR